MTTDKSNHVRTGTTFNISEVPERQRLDGTESLRETYRRLSVADSPDWDGGWKDRNKETEENSHAIIDSIASSFELTPHQKQRARRYFDALPDNYNQAYSTALLALCVCGFVGREDGRDYHPNNVRERKPTAENDIARLASELDLRYGQVFSCWNRLRGEF